MKNKKTIYIEDIFKKAENRLKNIVYSKNFKKWFFYSFFIALIIIIVIFYNAFKSSEEAEATWWDDTWSYRRAITVTNNNSEQSEVYINLTIDSSDTTKFQADCGDLRFTDINGNIIPYYIVSGCGTVSTSINVYYDTLKAGASTLYYYYGNSSADNGFSSTNFSTQALNYLVGSPSTEEKSKAPVGYWSFDEGYGTTAYDGSGKGNDGTITGATWASEDQCVVGKCLSFDGVDDYVQTSTVFNIPSGGDARTFSAWFKYRGDGGVIMGINSSSGQKYFLEMGKVSNTWYIFTDGLNGSNNITISSSELPEENTWNYITFILDDSNNWQYYLNGNLIKIGTFAISINTNTPSSVTIGQRLDVSGYVFDGFIDEPKIYPYARTADEIKQDYNAGLAGMGTSKGAGTAIGGSSDKWMSDGLVGHWKMDEASWNGTAGEVIDSSGNGNNGTSAGGATTGAGKFGSGGSFDGVDDYVDVNYFNIGTSITLSAWIKSSDYTGHVPLSLNGDSYASGPNLFFTSGGISWNIGDGGNNPFFIGSYPDSNWHHFIVINNQNENNAKLYIDGEYKGEAAYRNSTVTNGQFRIGDWHNGTYNINAFIDDVRIYNRALSPDEVKKLYEYAPGPVGHWKMDEKSGTTAYDISGNGNHGTLTNSPTWTEGKYGGAVEFDGVDDYVNGNLESSYSDYTVGGWVNRNGIQSANYPVFVAFGTYSPGFYLEFNDNDYVSYYRNGISVQTFFPLSDITINNWHYIVFKKEDSTISAYLDGKFKNSITDTDSLDNSFILNGDKAGVTPNITTHWGGKMDDFKIYNYARTQKQILEDMNAGRPAQNKPVAYWKFDEGYGTTAYNSGLNEIDGSLCNGVSWSSDGKIKKSLNFDGLNDYVAVSDSGVFDYQGEDKTFSFWVKVDSSEGGGNKIISKPWNGSGEYNYGFNWNGSGISINLEGTGGSQSFSTNTSMNIENWYHVASTIASESKKITFYINGKKDTSHFHTISSWTPDYGDSNLPLTIGTLYPYNCSSWAGNSGHAFQGQIDEIKIYNYALSENEIKKDYNQGKALVMGGGGTESDGSTPSQSSSREYCVPGDTATCNPPVAEWKFDDKSGTTVYDTSSNANHGTMSNMEDSDWKTSDQCKKGRCLEFDGSDDYAIKSSPKNLPTGDGSWSFDFWVFPRSGMQGIGRKGWIIWRGGSSNDLLSIGAEDNKWEIAHWSNDWTSNATIEFNNWQYVSVVYDSSIGAGLPDEFIYINGKLKDSREAGPLNLSDSDLYLGVRGDNLSEKADMVLDNVKIYNYARTPAQVAWDYNQGKPIGHWKMDEGEGMTVYDHSGNGNHGTMTNMTSDDWVEGKVNGGLEFDGVDDYVLINHDGQLQFKLGDFSVFSWANKNILAGWTGIITTDTTGDAAWKIYKDNDNDYFTARFGSTVLNYPSYSVGEWNHYGYVKKGTTLEIYFNGEFFNSIECSATHNVTNNELVFGSYRVYDAERGAYIFNGEIDDVQIYNYALTAEQIKEVYNGGAVRFR